MNGLSKKHVELVPLVALDRATQLRVREIRNEENVRKWMYTDHLISPAEHLAWLDRLKVDARQIVFVVLESGQLPLGVVSVGALDRQHRRAEWAYYLTETARGGLGSVLEYAFLEFVFQRLGIEKLNCEVIQGNDAVVKLHQKFLFQEEGFRRSHILKQGQRLGVHLLGLTHEDWRAGRTALFERYHQVFERFQVSIQWNNHEASTPPDEDDGG